MFCCLYLDSYLHLEDMIIFHKHQNSQMKQTSGRSIHFQGLNLLLVSGITQYKVGPLPVVNGERSPGCHLSPNPKMDPHKPHKPNVTTMFFLCHLWGVVTPPKFNIDPEKWWLEDYFPIGKVTFQGQTVKPREGISLKGSHLGYGLGPFLQPSSLWGHSTGFRSQWMICNFRRNRKAFGVFGCRCWGCIPYMGVSKNRGTPKSSILIGISIINHPFWGTTIFGNTHLLPMGLEIFTLHVSSSIFFSHM